LHSPLIFKESGVTRFRTTGRDAGRYQSRKWTRMEEPGPFLGVTGQVLLNPYAAARS
jgi:hypothetical protein